MSEESPKYGPSREEEKKIGKLSQDEEKVKDFCEKLDSVIRHADEMMEVIEANPLIKKDGFDFEKNRMMIHGCSELAKGHKEIIQHMVNPKEPFVSKTLLGKVLYDFASKNPTKELSLQQSTSSFERYCRAMIKDLDDLFARMKVVSKF